MNPWKGIKDLPHNIWLVSIVTLINRTGTMVLPFLALYITSILDRDPTDAGLVIAFYGIGALITAPFAGKLSDKIGELNLMKFSLIGSGIILFITSQINDYYLLLLIIMVWGIVNEAFRPPSLSFISNETTAEQRKTAFALYRLAINLGMSIGPVVGGILSQIDFSLLFYVDGATCIASGLYLALTKWNLREPLKQESHQEQHTGTLFSIFSNKAFLVFMLLNIPVQIIYMQAYPCTCKHFRP